MSSNISTDYQNPDYASQYNGAGKEGLLHGAYHFAIPNGPSAAAQAKYFVEHGGAIPVVLSLSCTKRVLQVTGRPMAKRCLAFLTLNVSRDLILFESTLIVNRQSGERRK
jgi:hypothetical protein